MRKFLTLLFLIPQIAFGTFTEFYCDNTNGNNVNSGSDSGTSVYTCTNGNWSTSTNIFTVTNGTNPATANPGVAVGQFASIYVDGATEAVFIGRVTAVQNATNGTITISSTARCGTAPSTSVTARTIKVGGCWKGPNGASGFPFSIAGTGVSTAQDASGDTVRVNMKNTSNYTVTTGISEISESHARWIQGYSSSVGDGGRATITTSSNIATVFSGNSVGGAVGDMIFSSTSPGPTAGNGYSNGSSTELIFRCIFTGNRNSGVLVGGGTNLIECEAYNNNIQNTSEFGGFQFAGSGVWAIRCYAHDNSTGTHCHGFVYTNGNVSMLDCVSESNGGKGLYWNASNTSQNHIIKNCDFYNNTSDAIFFGSTTTTDNSILIENCNFIKNGGKAINNSISTLVGLSFNNGYGAGTQANGSSDTLGGIVESGKVTYANDITPWVAPSTGDFRINLAAALNAGRGSFMQTGNSKTGTVAYPDIGAAQHYDTQKSFTFGQ